MLQTSAKRDRDPKGSSSNSISALRTITTLLSTPDPTLLPTHIPTIISLLYSSSVLESCHSLSQQKKKGSEDAGVLLHKYKTRISSLLQSKIAQARWCGAALVKASVESSFECLAGNGGVWMRLLVPLLVRPEPPTTHHLTIATLTRVFTVLTDSKPAIIRELVSPNLPTTIGHLLSLSSTEESGLLAAVLEALRDILHNHPVTFRPFATRTYTLVLNILSASSAANPDHERLAREIFAALHLCASGSSSRNTDASSSSSVNKATAVADEWTRGFKAVVEEANLTLNTLLRCIHEDHSSTSQTDNTLNLPSTTDAASGVHRCSLLLRLLGTFFALSSSTQVSIPLGQLLVLTTRILAVAPSRAQINQAIERTEREFVYACLPALQKDALDLLASALGRLGGALIPCALMLVEQVAGVFDEYGWNSEVRCAVYNLLNGLLENFGAGLPKTTVHAIHSILSATCDDLLPPITMAPTAPTKNNTGKQKNGQTIHADSLLTTTPANKLPYPGLMSSASTLLATALAHLPTAHIKSELRTKLDRTAVLTNNTEAMLASVLFPPVGARRGGAILPHLVGSVGGRGRSGLFVEGVVRPRLPVIWTGQREGDEVGTAGEEEDEEESEDSEDDVEQAKESAERVASVSAPSAPSAKKPHPDSEEIETTDSSSPYKRQKTFSAAQETIAARKPSLLDDMLLAQARSSVFAETPAPPPPPVAAVSSSSVISTATITKTATVAQPRDFTEAAESDDDMVIPEIVMGGDSSDEEDE